MTRKKLKITAISFVLFLVALEILTVLANDFFFEKVAGREVKKRGMPTVAANAVKHAYAASLLYSTFRGLYFSENVARNFTISLGKVNEIAEVVFKARKDSSLEMMKDLNNNVIGICAANWIEEHRENPLSHDRLDFIGFLAEQNKLMISREDISLPEEEKEKARKSSSYSTAKKWFDENESKIICDF